ncbi:signal peptidase II [Gordonia sp. VNK21]|uniref:signal peptidase II n=1 Tax=Gordonia sp. VNK21 TaxID=3382483 RepID=UPI0038D4C3A6
MTEPAPPASGARASSSRTLLVVLAVTALAAYLLDLLTKTLAVDYLDPADPVQIIGDTVTLTLIRNSGAAFSMATGYTWILTFVALAVVAVIIRYSRRLGSLGWVIGLGLVLGGALGNLTDRIFREPGPLRGHVVDFVSVGWWPVFNVADSAVVCGAVLLVVLTLLGYDYDGSRSGWAARHEPGFSDDDQPAGGPDAGEQGTGEQGTGEQGTGEQGTGEQR